MASFYSQNPATDEVLWKGKEATTAEIHDAVQKAEDAFLSFRKTSFEERAHTLWKFATLLSDAFAETIAQETGKPLWDAKEEVQAMKNKIDISIQAYHERCPVRMQALSCGTSITRHCPHGVVAVFGPYNFPGHLPNGHIIPALLAGNTVIFKPSELTPKVGEELGKLFQEAGLAKNVLQVVQGGKNVGQALLSEKAIRAVLFTGSYTAGKAILEHSLQFPDRIVALEMGGNNPLIVSKTADVDAAVYLTIQSAYVTSGQRCTAARRLILIENSTQEAYLEQLIKKTKELIIGPYTLKPEPFMGPLVTKAAADKVLQHYEGLVSRGAKVLLPVKRLGEDSAFLTPGLVDMTGIEGEGADVEIFGPLLQIFRVKNLDEAIVKANDTGYGLCASIITDSEPEFNRVYEEVRVGIINWNMPTTGASSVAPFGGLGLSGNFRPAGYYSVDYCAYPIASIENDKAILPQKLPPGYPQ